MSEKQKEIMETFKELLPKLREEDLSYILGFGEGVAAGMRCNPEYEEPAADKAAEMRA